MPTFEEKMIVKSYKLKIKNKFKCLLEETEEVVNKLRSCVSLLHERLEELLKSEDDEHFLSQNQKLNTDFEKHQEKLFYLLVYLDGATTDDDNEAAVSEESCSIPGDISISPNQHSEQNSTLKNPAAFQSETSISSSSYRSLQDCNNTNQIPFGIKTEYNAESSANDYAENYSSISSASRREHLICMERSCLPDCELDLKDTEKSISQSSCYRSLTSSCNQSSTSSNFLIESSVSGNTEVKQLAANDTCSYSQFIPNILVPPAVPLNTVFSATLAYIINPSDFWMQFKNSKGCEISFPMSEFKSESSPSFIREGDYCLAPFKSLPYYYRAKTLNEALGSEDVEVFFIDYGSTQKISLRNLRPLPRSAFEIPMQAFRCKLFNISPVKGIWTFESIEKLKEFQNNSIETRVKSFECDKYAVQLVATLSALFSNEFSCDIAHALCLDGLATLDMAPQSDQEFCDTDISNQASCDSGVSVTSNIRTTPCIQKFPYSSDLIETNIPFIDSGSVSALLNKNGQQSQDESQTTNDVHQNLISFESAEEVHEAAGEILAAPQDEYTLLHKRCSKTPGCDCMLHLTIPPPSISFVEKDMMLVMVSNIVTPSEFYVNLAMENSFTLDELQEQMTALYESQTDSLLIKDDDLKEGMFCAARYNLDCNWYRVVILKIHTYQCESSCDVYVQYIDYGNKATVRHDDLKPLLPKFAQHPSFSIKCSLAGVVPKHTNLRAGNHASELWNEEAVSKFKELTTFDRCLTAEICESRFPLSTPIGSSHSCESRPIQVLLWDTEGKNDLLINEALVETGLAEIDTSFVHKIQLDNTISSREKAVFKLWDPMDEEFNNIENSYGVHVEDSEVAILGYKQNDESYTCKYFSLRGSCPRGDRCPYQHIDLAAGGVTRDQEETYSIDTTPSLPYPSSNVLIQVSAVISPGVFYSVLLFSSKTVDEIHSLIHSGTSAESFLRSGDEIKILNTAMNEYYNNSPFAENTAVALAFGSIVAAWRKVDEAWRRARIIEVSDIAGPSKVFFVDSGDEDWVPRKSIREILPEYLHTPFQAIECHLSDVEPLGFEKGKNWSSQAVSRFRELVSNQVLLAHVIFRCDKILHVTLRKTTEENHDSISCVLVREGFAQYQTIKASALKETKYVPG